MSDEKQQPAPRRIPVIDEMLWPVIDRICENIDNFDRYAEVELVEWSDPDVSFNQYKIETDDWIGLWHVECQLTRPEDGYFIFYELYGFEQAKDTLAEIFGEGAYFDEGDVQAASKKIDKAVRERFRNILED